MRAEIAGILIASLAGLNASSASADALNACATSLQSLVDAAAPGSTVQAQACIYRETVRIDKPLTLAGQGGSEIRGSDVWADWRQVGGTWVSAQTVPPLRSVGDPDGRCASSAKRCTLPQQVFVNGTALYPQTGVGKVEHGEFAFDDARHVILADDPTGHTVEVSTRQAWIETKSDGVTIQGFTMHHVANDALTGGVSNRGHANWTLRDNILTDAHGAVVSMSGGHDVSVIGNDISRGGDMGIHGTLVQQGLVQGNRMHQNNTDEFNVTWGAGALKVTEVNGFVIDNNEVDSNAGVGLWCDIDCHDVTFSNNRIHDNTEPGILFEVSDGARIVNNTLWENGWSGPTWGLGAGILLSSSANVEVSNNTLAWNKAGITVVEQNRRDAVHSRNIAVTNNKIIRNVVTDDYWSNLSLAWLEEGERGMFDEASNNRASNNLFWYDRPETDSVRVAWQGHYAHLAESVSTPGVQGARYMSDAEKDEHLTARALPGRGGLLVARAP